MAWYTGGSGIQWAGPIQSQNDLAHVIQGESATPEGQFGVASVMWNRQQAGGFGSDIPSIVTPNQFNGYSITPPSANAQSLAADLWAGRAPQGGSTGNALYFAAPSDSNAAWANPNTSSGQGLFGHGGNNLGGNYYSDNAGPPSANFQAPVYGGTQTLHQSNLAANDSGYNVASSPGAANDLAQGAQDSANQSGYNIASSAGSEQDLGQAAQSDTSTTAAANASVTGPSGPNVTANAQSVPAAIDQQTKAQAQDTGAIDATTAANTAAQNQTNQADTAATNQTSVSDTGAALQSGTSWINSFFGFGTDIFKRGGLVVIGLAFIAIALFLLGAHELFSSPTGRKAAAAALS